MQIILGKRNKGKLSDSIEYILNASKKEFRKIIGELYKPTGEVNFLYQAEADGEEEFIETVNIGEILESLSKVDFNKLDIKAVKRVMILLGYRTEDDLRDEIADRYHLSSQDVNSLFEILKGNKDFLEFIKEKENEEKLPFAFLRKNKRVFNNQQSMKSFYYIIMQRIMEGDYSYNYYFPERESYRSTFVVLKTRMIAEKNIDAHEIVIKDGDEPDWEINDELVRYVYENMPMGLSPEETAIWIYMKLCQTLKYDDSQVFDLPDDSIDIEKLENIKPNSRVVCFDFARLYAKFVNQMLKGDAEAVVVGKRGHYYAEVITKNIVAEVESVNVIYNTNEFFKVKMGLPIEGFKGIHDPQGIIKKAIRKLTLDIYDKPKVMETYLHMLNTIALEELYRPDEAENVRMEGIFRSLADIMIDNQVSGTEAVEGIMRFHYMGFFGRGVDIAWIKNRFLNKDGKKDVKSCTIIGKNGKYFVLDSETMIVEAISKEDIIEKFKTGEYSYKDARYGLKELELELLDYIYTIGENR